MTVDFKLPELGENITKAGVVRVLVNPGDVIAKDQPVVEIETDKAALEVPSTVAGRVVKVHVKAGEEAAVGAPLLTLEPAEGTAGPATVEEVEEKKPKTPAAQPAPKPQPPVEAKPEPERAVQSGAQPAMPAVSQAGMSMPSGAPASPAVRRLAREIGVEIAQVTGTGPGGRISAEDVKAFARARAQAAPAGAPAASPEALPDFSKYGPIEKRPTSKIRRLIAQRLTYAWAAIPHVHQFDRADITGLEELRKRYNEGEGRSAGVKLTATAFLIKVAAAALKKYPQFNSSLSADGSELIYKQYYHIGVAVDTERGLLVPVLRDADKKTVVQISRELDELARRAREGRIAPDEMRGGTFTISNLGGIGGTAFAPIINYPEVAILGVARAGQELVLVDGQPAPRLILPLCLGYDHRVIDGADGARFLSDLARMLADPYELLLYA
ncbi:2-oxo acid dehydrogenase subunit E2 [bacterium]|nr:2-oxo acid dehydrogenase subunit E2 [bacterium]